MTYIFKCHMHNNTFCSKLEASNVYNIRKNFWWGSNKVIVLVHFLLASQCIVSH